MLHEFTHLSFKAKDNAYLCVASYESLDPTTGAKILKTGSLGIKFNQDSILSLGNADSYRCWAEDVAVNGAKPSP